MLERSHNESPPRPRLGWVINAGALLLSVLIVLLALAETGGVWTIWTVLLSLGGISALVITGLLVIVWLRGHAKPPVERTVERIDG